MEGGELKEYSAHVIPEGGWDAMPRLSMPGLLVAGDAACFCLAAGIWLEGVNMAMGAGLAAARTGSPGDRRRASTTSTRCYRRELGFVVENHRKLRLAPHLVLSERIQQQYPQLVASIVERVFQVDDPGPKAGLRRIVLQESTPRRAEGPAPREGRLDVAADVRVRMATA